MTIEEAIADKNRPLSMSPKEWMQYEEAREHEEVDLVDDEARRIVAEEKGVPVEEFKSVEISSEDKLEIGIDQMVLGCRMAMRSLQELSREDVTPERRKCYAEICDLVDNAVAPYLADVLDAMKTLAKLSL